MSCYELPAFRWKKYIIKWFSKFNSCKKYYF